MTLSGFLFYFCFISPDSKLHKYVLDFYVQINLHKQMYVMIYTQKKRVLRVDSRVNNSQLNARRHRNNSRLIAFSANIRKNHKRLFFCIYTIVLLWDSCIKKINKKNGSLCLTWKWEKKVQNHKI